MIHYGEPRNTVVDNPELASSVFQRKLEKMWQILEQGGEDLFRMNSRNEMVAVLDEYNMIQLFEHNAGDATEAFDAVEEHDEEAGAWVWVGLPYHLCGTYTIKGNYTPQGRLIRDAVPTYFFSQEF